MSSLKQQHETLARDVADEHKFRRFYSITMVLGLMVGVVIQISTMGANFLVMSYYGDRSDNDAVYSTRNVISFCWSTFTSTIAFIMLGFIRGLLEVGYQRIRSHDGDEESDDENDDENADSLLQVEHRFVAGAMVGVCFSWAITDIVLGLNVQVLYSIITLALALIWCQIVLNWSSSSRRMNGKPQVDDSYIAVV